MKKGDIVKDKKHGYDGIIDEVFMNWEDLKSKKLYQKMRKEKRLSPNVLDRFQEYENIRSQSKIVKTINRIKEVTNKC